MLPAAMFTQLRHGLAKIEQLLGSFAVPLCLQLVGDDIMYDSLGQIELRGSLHGRLRHCGFQFLLHLAALVRSNQLGPQA